MLVQWSRARWSAQARARMRCRSLQRPHSRARKPGNRDRRRCQVSMVSSACRGTSLTDKITRRCTPAKNFPVLAATGQRAALKSSKGSAKERTSLRPICDGSERLASPDEFLIIAAMVARHQSSRSCRTEPSLLTRTPKRLMQVRNCHYGHISFSASIARHSGQTAVNKSSLEPGLICSIHLLLRRSSNIVAAASAPPAL